MTFLTTLALVVGSTLSMYPVLWLLTKFQPISFSKEDDS